jgi:hypothetical protein
LRTPKLPIAVNGTGDLFAALFFHRWLAVTHAAGSRELALFAAQDELVRPSRLIEAEAVSARQEGVIVLGGAEREGNLKSRMRGKRRPRGRWRRPSAALAEDAR